MMELGKVFLPRKSVNVLFSAVHAKHGIAWTDGLSVHVTPIYAKYGSSEPLKLGEFSSVRSLQWSRDVGHRLCYLSVVSQNEVTLWTVKGKWPKLTVKLACKLHSAPINNGCLWHPVTDIICILSSHRAKLHFHHELDTRGSYTLPQIQSGKITCGSWSTDGLKLAVMCSETVVVYSWPGDSAGIGDHEMASWKVPGLCGCLISIVALDNNIFATTSEMRFTVNATDEDYLTLPQSPPPKLIRATGGEGDVVRPRSSHLSLSEKLLNLQQKDLTTDSSSLLVFTTAPECRKITSLNIPGILKPDLLCYNGKSRIILVGSNHYRKLKLYSFKTDQLSHYADIDVGENGRPRGVCSSQNPLGFFSAIAVCHEDSVAFLPSSKGIQCDLTVKFHALKAEEKKPRKTQRMADTKSRTTSEPLPKRPLIEEISDDGQTSNKGPGSCSPESQTKVKSLYNEVPDPVMVDSDTEEDGVVNLGLVHSSLAQPSDEATTTSLDSWRGGSIIANGCSEPSKMSEVENGSTPSLECPDGEAESCPKKTKIDLIVDEHVDAAESSISLEPPTGFADHTVTSIAHTNGNSFQQNQEESHDDDPNSISNGHVLNSGGVEEMYPAENAYFDLQPPAGFSNDLDQLSDKPSETFHSQVEIVETLPLNSSTHAALGKDISSLSKQLEDDGHSFGELSDMSDHSDCTGEMKVEDLVEVGERQSRMDSDIDELYQAYRDTYSEGSLFDDLADRYSGLGEVQEDVCQVNDSALLRASVERADDVDCTEKPCDSYSPPMDVDIKKPNIPIALQENTPPAADPKISLVFPEVTKSPIRSKKPRQTLTERMAYKLSMGTNIESCSNPELVERLSCHLSNKEIPAETKSSCTDDELEVSKCTDSEKENFCKDKQVNGIKQIDEYKSDIPHPEVAPGKDEALETGRQSDDVPVDPGSQEKKLGFVDNIKRPFLKLRHVFDDHGDTEQDLSSLSTNDELVLCFDDYDIIEMDDELLKDSTVDDENEENPFFSESQQTEIVMPDGQRSPSVADRIKVFFTLRKNSGPEDENEAVPIKSEDQLEVVAVNGKDNNDISVDEEDGNRLNSEGNLGDSAIEPALTNGEKHASGDECDIAESKEVKKPSMRRKLVNFFSFGKETPKNDLSDSGAELNDQDNGSPQSPTEVEVHQLQYQVDLQKQHLDQLKEQIFRLTRALQESECRKCALSKHSAIYKDPDTVTVVCNHGEESLQKEFALVNGQIKLSEVKMAFKMDTIEIMKGDGSFVVGADRGGFIPIQFPPGATIHIQDNSEC